MYDVGLPATEEVKPELTLKCCNEVGRIADFTDLNTPEISLDLQNYINESVSQATLDDNIFDLLPEKTSRSSFNNPLIQQGSRVGLSYGFHMRQQPGVPSNKYGSEAGAPIKQEPNEGPTGTNSQSSNFGYFEYTPNRSSSQYNSQNLGTYTPSAYGRASLSGVQEVSSPSHNGTLKRPGSVQDSQSNRNSKKKNIDKSSDEYKKRRERNNIAVRKSREKAKQRSKDTERRVNDLIKENESLKKRVDILTKELGILKSLLTNVGVSPESVDTEIAKTFNPNTY
uniref:CCAAT/enhancer-binding protein alpha n=1 Tax=Hadrurus spadix TaxID=141984 RepID=A0A1W7RAK7_9SCOR